MRTPLANPITGTVTALLATLIGAIGCAGPWPSVSEDVVTLTGAQRDWVVAMWAAALTGIVQELSNWLSEQWDYGIHSLLNKPPAANIDDPFTQWRERVNDWRERVIAGRRDRGCGKQDLLSVNTLGLIPNISGPSFKPGVAHAMGMLILRLGRVADVAKKYGDRGRAQRDRRL